VVKGHSSKRPGVTVGKGGKFSTLLRFGGKRTVVFNFSDDFGSAVDKVRINVTRR
jgi:hypothetical protein